MGVDALGYRDCLGESIWIIDIDIDVYRMAKIKRSLGTMSRSDLIYKVLLFLEKG